MIPSDVWVEPHLPLLGSGKVDMVSVASLVHERLASRPETIARAMG
jgi:hypothetical protein